MRIHAIVAVLSLVFSINTASAGEIEINRLVECPKVTGADPSIVSKTAVHSRSDCKKSAYRVNYALRDTRFGILYWLGVPSLVPLTKEVIEPDADDVFDNMKACMTVFGEGAMIDEWLVPDGQSCEGRSSASTWWRRYTPTLVCLMPQVTCISISDLKPVAQERARQVLERAHGKYVSRSRFQ